MKIASPPVCVEFKEFKNVRMFKLISEAKVVELLLVA
jgi:hypothetical protein